MGHPVAKIGCEHRNRMGRRNASCKIIAQRHTPEFVGLDEFGNDKELACKFINAMRTYDVRVIAKAYPCFGFGPETLAYSGPIAASGL